MVVQARNSFSSDSENCRGNFLNFALRIHQNREQNGKEKEKTKSKIKSKFSAHRGQILYVDHSTNKTPKPEKPFAQCPSISLASRGKHQTPVAAQILSSFMVRSSIITVVHFLKKLLYKI
ncbi:hypothetical protein ACJX0J_006152 [Zea mays]